METISVVEESMDPENYVMVTGRLRAAPGVYVITHRGSGLVYVGSSVNMRKRWGKHCYHLRKGDHSSPHLQNAWTKYGEPWFTVRCIEQTAADKAVLMGREQFWIEALECIELGYNTCPAAYSNLGTCHSPETIAKMALSRRGEANINALLTEPAVLAMRRLRGDGMQCKELAKLFAVQRGTVSDAVTGRSWGHLPGAVATGKTRGEMTGTSRLTEPSACDAEASWRWNVVYRVGKTIWGERNHCAQGRDG